MLKSGGNLGGGKRCRVLLTKVAASRKTEIRGCGDA